MNKVKVLHLMLSNFYIDNANYQENILPRIHKREGHEVLIVASTDVFVENNKLGLTTPKEYINEDGIKVIRIPYLTKMGDFINMKIRSYKGLMEIMEAFLPDIILFHGTAAYELNNVCKFVKRNPKTKLLVDSHEDFNNSARGWLSKNILHRFFYKPILLRNLKYIDKVLYITKETYNFQHDFYKVPKHKLKFFPLGGEVPNADYRQEIRNTLRRELGVKSNDIVCVHSGKLDKLKRTDEILSAFSSCKRTDIKLLVIGTGDESFSNIQMLYAQDKRIMFLGWLPSFKLRDYLMASDLYIQLGSQSATMQQAICNGNVVAVYPFESHCYLLTDNCFYIQTEDDLKVLLDKLSISELEVYRKKSETIAREVLDYNKISEIIFE